MIQQQPTIDTDVDHPSQTKPSRLKPASQPYLIFLSVSGRVNLNGSQSSILSTRVNEILLCADIQRFILHLDFWKSRSWEIKVYFKP
jgi:hypothetical protein